MKKPASPRANSIKKATPARNKYFLRDLHQEIDLYDRKLAYLDKCTDFASAADREEAHEKLLAKRASLERAARELAAAGIEFDNKDLPRSFHAENHEEDGAPTKLSLVKPS